MASLKYPTFLSIHIFMLEYIKYTTFFFNPYFVYLNLSNSIHYMHIELNIYVMQFKMVDSKRFVGLLVHLRMRLSHQKFNAHKVNTSCIIIQRNVLTLNQTRRSKLKNKYIYKKVHISLSDLIIF